MVTVDNIPNTKILVAVHEEALLESLLAVIKEHFATAKIYQAKDGNDAIRKITSDQPDILILDAEIKRCSSDLVLKEVYGGLKSKSIQTVFFSCTGAAFGLEDLVTTGDLQTISMQIGVEAFVAAVYKAMNRVSPHDGTFKIRYLRQEELLIKQGERADTLYILKKGLLTAFAGDPASPIILGQIGVGEFVGEMAYINGEPRSASVKAEQDSELVEFKIDTFDQILYKKPSWMKALVKTLSKRVKALNLFQVRTKESK